jgi:hypothetical protein
LHSNALLMSSEDPGFDGTAAHGPAVLSVEKKLRRIMLSVGIQKQSLENPSGPQLTPPPKQITSPSGRFDCGCLDACCFDGLAL